MIVCPCVSVQSGPFLPEYVRAVLAIACISDHESVDRYSIHAAHRWWTENHMGKQEIGLSVVLSYRGEKMGEASFKVDRHSYYNGHAGYDPARWWDDTIARVRGIETDVHRIGLGDFENTLVQCQSAFSDDSCGLATESVGKTPACMLCVYQERNRQEELQRAEREAERKEREMRRSERNKMTPALRWRVLDRDGFKCRHCGKGADDGVKLHVDHVLPVALGGATQWENLQSLCAECNMGKRTSIQSQAPSPAEPTHPRAGRGGRTTA